VMILKQFLGVPRAKALNHTPRIPRTALYVKRMNDHSEQESAGSNEFRRLLFNVHKARGCGSKSSLEMTNAARPQSRHKSSTASSMTNDR
jgi:hypothetical protein